MRENWHCTRVDDNINYPYIFNIDGFHWCFDDTEIILSALWLLFDVRGI